MCVVSPPAVRCLLVLLSINASQPLLLSMSVKIHEDLWLSLTLCFLFQVPLVLWDCLACQEHLEFLFHLIYGADLEMLVFQALMGVQVCVVWKLCRGGSGTIQYLTALSERLRLQPFPTQKEMLGIAPQFTLPQK